jgi:hypothetical protein
MGQLAAVKIASRGEKLQGITQETEVHIRETADGDSRGGETSRGWKTSTWGGNKRCANRLLSVRASESASPSVSLLSTACASRDRFVPNWPCWLFSAAEACIASRQFAVPAIRITDRQNDPPLRSPLQCHRCAAAVAGSDDA